MKIVAKLVATAAAVLAIANYGLIPGIAVSGFGTALLAALLLGALNLLVRPVLLILALPINILTLGLFTFVINAFLFWLVPFVVPGFTIAGFYEAFLGALVIVVVQWIVDKII